MKNTVKDCKLRKFLRLALMAWNIVQDVDRLTFVTPMTKSFVASMRSAKLKPVGFARRIIIFRYVAKKWRKTRKLKTASSLRKK